MKHDTIAAIATAHGIGSIAIVRLSGDDALRIALKVTQKSSLTPRYAHLSTLYSCDNKPIDQALVLYFQNPKSFTGEESVEFQCHGGYGVASLLIDTLLHHGARMATPGEFSKRALLNGKMDLAQAEAASALIQARSHNAVHVLANQLKGELGKFVNDIRKDLIAILAYNEVLIDYAEEDLPPNVTQQITTKLTAIATLLENTLQSSNRRQGVIEGYKIAIIGKPNVGKSSLLNALLSYNRAIVSDIAGTTRDTIEENITLGTHFVKIVDTAGIRDAGDAIEKIGIERSIAAINEATIVLAMFDQSREWEEDDDRIVEILGSYGKNKDILAIMNKSDLPQVHLKESLKAYDVKSISCKDDISSLLTWMTNKLDGYDTTADILLVSKRQHNAVKAAQEAITASLSPLNRGELEFFSFHVKEAIDAIGSITQPYDVEGMLDVMFGTFCLGK